MDKSKPAPPSEKEKLMKKKQKVVSKSFKSNTAQLSRSMKPSSRRDRRPKNLNSDVK